MNKPIQSIAVLALTLSALFFAACQKEQTSTNPSIEQNASKSFLDEHLKAYEIVTLDPQLLFEQATVLQNQGGGLFQIPQLNVQIYVKPNELLLNDMLLSREISASGEVAHAQKAISWSGSMSGDDYSEARLLLTEEHIGGFWTKQEEQFFIEPLQLYDPNAAKNQFVIHKKGDEIITKSYKCANDAPEPAKLGSIPKKLAAASCWKLEVACDGDYEYFKNKAGGNFNLAVYAIGVTLNNASVKYAVINLNLVLAANGIGIYTDPNSVWYYPKSGNINTLLGQIKDFHNYFHGSFNRDTWVLFSGKPLGGGLAWVDVVCNNRSLSYAVVEWVMNSTYLQTITAHEIGHNLGANHINDNSLMHPYYNVVTNNYFTQTSKDQMNVHIWYNHGCLSTGACN